MEAAHTTATNSTRIQAGMTCQETLQQYAADHERPSNSNKKAEQALVLFGQPGLYSLSGPTAQLNLTASSC